MRREKAFFITVMLLASALFSVYGGGKQAAPASGATKVAVVFGLGGLGDKSFNDDAMTGIQRAKTELGIEYQYVEPKEIAEIEGHHRYFARSGEYELIIGIGFDSEDAIELVGAEFPNQKFAVIDGETKISDNVVSMSFKDNEKTYLIGVIAGLTTKTNKIGMVGGMDIPLINSFAAGYRAGARSVNPNIQVDVRYVGAWNDANTGKELAMSLYNAGADIVYAAAGGSGLGVFSAAKDANKLAVGADVNQIPLDPDHIFLSSIRRVDNAVYNEIEKVVKGGFKGGRFIPGLKEGVVGYTVEGAKVPTPQSVIDRAEQAKQDVISGKVVVPTAL
ncbi:MAG: BMP family ABC transporter substrate-binding protein [Treponema sp.]|jgi:basic membrane protein A|nr:BMP family ABC transporter substrate-binding protein [Treponema sp.]